MSLRPKSLSPTCLETYKTCLLKFWFKYHTKQPDVGDTEAMRFGSSVHAALEFLNKRLMFGEPLTQQICEEAAQEFLNCAAENRIADPDLLKEGQDMLRSRIFKHNPNYPIKGIELSFYNLQITTDRGVPLNGIIDLVQEMTPDTALIIDYKTSKRAKTLQEARKDIQLSMYDYMFSKLNPQYRQIWMALDFLRSEPVITERTLEERNLFEQWLNGVWEAMGKLTEKDVKPSLNQFCPWCGYKHLCSAHKAVMDASVEFKPISTLEDEAEFASEWKLIKSIERMAKSRADELKMWANNKVEFDNVFKFESDDSVVSWNTSYRTSYDPARIIPYVPMEDLPRLVRIDNNAIMSYVNLERPDLQGIVNAAAIKNSGSKMTVRKK